MVIGQLDFKKKLLIIAFKTHLNFNIMAIQDSFIKIKGSLGGLTFYEKDGKSLIKTSSGVTKERIMTDPKYKRTRENMVEFGASAKIGKSFRTGFASIRRVVGDNSLTGRVTGLMKQVNKAGNGIRGQRSFEIVANKNLIEGFEFKKNLKLSSVFYAPFAAPVVDANRSVVDLVIPDFNTSNLILAPEGATHFKVALSASVLSDLEYDVAEKAYAFVNPDENEMNTIVFSTEIPLGGMIGTDISIQADLGFSSALPTSVGVVIGVGILFYQEMNGQFYDLARNNAFRIEMVG